MSVPSESGPTPPQQRPLVIAHRGLPSVFPDHTLAGYEAAARLGADFLEPDLVPTKDGHLICRHENDLTHTTDVAERFPDLRRTKVVDGTEITGWFSEDLTLAEVRSLRAKQPLDFRPKDQDGLHTIPTFGELIGLVKRLQSEMGRPIGLYPETKHPSYFQSVGLPLEEPLVDAIHAAGWSSVEAPVFLQSFEAENLKDLRNRTRVRLIRLIDEPGDLLTPAGLAEIATYADGVGVHKSHLIGDDGVANDVVAHAHAAGLLVHVYTFRDEARYLPSWAEGSAEAELRAFHRLGIDGLFTDHSRSAITAISE
ncbi:MAG: glycerophosphodiester phosphodiesterase [Myxococcales bacterium]|nr:glycerophosphodiester phosphodiesterase [Myxococcales bacterium]